MGRLTWSSLNFLLKGAPNMKRALFVKNLANLDFYSNNFDFLRFFAATLVILGHSYPLLGLSGDPLIRLSHGTLALGPLGLAIFFVISGLLITKSWNDSPSLIQYFKKRILRIFPGLFIATLFSVLIVGPLVTSYPINDYLKNFQTWDYVRNAFMQTRMNLPGVFNNNPINAVNGSIWSLPVEFWLYIFISLFGVLKIFTKTRLLIPIISLLVMFFQMFVLTRAEYRGLVFVGISAKDFFGLAVYFFIGSSIYLYQKYFIFDFRIAILATIALLVSFSAHYGYLILPLSLSYLIIFFAFDSNFSCFRHFGKYGDFSYGMYVYAFPIQQTIVHFLGTKMEIIPFFGSSFITTTMFAVLSWHLIEKKALKLKNAPVLLFNNMISLLSKSY